jgi:hypothetical protein
MATQRPAPTDHDVLSSGPEESARSRIGVLVGVAATCLVVGFLAGGRTGVPTTAGTGDRSSTMPLTAGAIDQRHDDAFELPLFNWTDTRIDVTVVHLDGWSSRVRSTTTSISAATWGVVPFSARADCGDPPPAHVRFVRLRVRTPAGVSEEELPLPGGGSSVLTHHDALCGTGLPGGD